MPRVPRKGCPGWEAQGLTRLERTHSPATVDNMLICWLCGTVWRSSSVPATIGIYWTIDGPSSAQQLLKKYVEHFYTALCQREAGTLRQSGRWQLFLFQRGLDLQKSCGMLDTTYVRSYLFASGWSISLDWPAGTTAVSISRPAPSQRLTFAPSGARSVFAGSTAATGSLMCALCVVAHGARCKGEARPFFGLLRNLVLTCCTAVELSGAIARLDF